MGMDLYTLEKPKAVPAAYLREHSDPGYYRFNVQGMAAMVSLMRAAGVLSDEPMPEFPPEPRAKDPALQESFRGVMMGKKEERARLPPDELKRADAHVEALRKATGTRSADPRKVPAFKFESNSGWFISPDECRLIAVAVRAYARQLSGDEVRAANAASSKADAKLTAQLAPKLGTQATKLSPSDLGMSKDELRKWMLDWADFNTLASFAGGYEVD